MSSLSLRSLLVCLLLSVAGAAAAPAAVVTDLTGTGEGIISNRHQEHLWVTSDRWLHAIINDGTEGKALNFYSSRDGANWFLQGTVPWTDKNTQSDGVVVGDTLYLVYPSSQRHLMLRTYGYDRALKTWTLSGEYTILAQSQHVPDRPTITLDGNLRVWVAFSDLDRDTGNVIIKVAAQGDTLGQWNTPLQFGTRNASEIKTGRLLALSDGVMLVYTDGPHPNSDAHTLNWAYRLNSAPLTAAWTSGGTLYQFATLENDQFGCHFNAAVDRADNVHIASRADDRLIYFRIAGYLNSWVDPRYLSASDTAPYVQVSLSAQDDLFIIYPHKPTSNAVVLRSGNAGLTFQTVAALEYQPGVELGFPRLESPSHFLENLPVLRQISPSIDSYGLVFFNLNTSAPP